MCTPTRGSLPGLKLALCALTIASASPIAGCGGPTPAPERPKTASSCDARSLDACERSIGDALSRGAASRGGLVTRSMMSDYANARKSADPADPWAKLWSELVSPEKGGPAVIVEEAQAADVDKSVAAPHRAIRTAAALPDPKGISADELLLAMGEAASVAHIIHLRGDGKSATELFPRDALSPFMAGLRPILRSDADPRHIDAHIRLAASVNDAIGAAGDFDYVKAATLASSLDSLIAGLDDAEKTNEPVLRARYAVDLLSAAGLGLDPENPADDNAASPPPAPAAAPPSPTDTPYGDLIRVRLAKEPSAEWPIRSARILAAIPADRRDAIPSLFRRANDCSALRPPPVDGARDIIFAGRLAASLDKGTTGAPTAANPDALLPLPEWYKRYEILTRAVDETHTMWSAAPSLLYERGEVGGLSPASTGAYERVTALAVKHIAAVQALEHAFPARYRPLSHLGLVYSGGVLADPQLRDGVIRLTQTTVQDKLAHAADAKGVFEAALTGVFAGMSYPPAIQEAHYLALQGAFTAKLKGDLMTRAGWGVAGLYAADALFRILTDQGRNLTFTAEQVARSLSDPAVEMPSLAALAKSFARYGALGAEGRLDPEQTKIERFPAERRAAREALKSAIGGLGEKDGAPAGLLDDVTELADGLIATVSLALNERKPAQAGDAPVCAKKADAAGPSPAIRRAIARLSDVRRRILLHPQYKNNNGAWARRVKLLVTIVSDAMDIVGKTSPRPTFTISDADAEAAVAGALRDWDERAAADALSGAYGLARRGFAAKDAEAFMKQNGQNLRRVFGGLALFFKDEKGSGKATSAVAMLDALASMPLSAAADGDLLSVLLSYAEAFYAKDQVDQGDLWLLSTLVLSGLADAAPADKTIALADKRSKRLAWVLRFLADVNHTRSGSIPDPAAYEAGMRKATDDACSTANADDVLGVMSAIKSFASGDRSRARADLDRALAAMESRGLSVPKMTYKYEEKTTSKVFSVTLAVSYGAGMLSGANTFQVGIGVKSPGDPGGSLTASLSPPDAAQAGEEAARYYIHAAALAAAYHFLEGDAPHATAAARRAIDALAFGVRLGSRTLPSSDPVAWGADARALLAIDAQLAAEADLPFLAGDLWTMVKGSLAKDAADSDVADVLSTAPFGLAAVKGADAIRERAAKSLKVVAAPLACTEEKVEVGAYEEPSCEAYPVALSLRIADALKKLPRLRPGGGSSRRCASAKTLDAFLSAADKGTYDPDAFTAAVEERKADGDLYSAAILLSRQRKDAHCSPAIVASARSLAGSSALGSNLRADLLGTAVNCSLASASLSQDVVDDLVALDTETQRLPDLTRNLRLLLSVTDLAVHQNKEAPMIAIATRPGFIDRWLRVNPNAGTAALLIESAARTLAEGSSAAATTPPAAHAGPPGPGQPEAASKPPSGSSTADTEPGAAASMKRSDDAYRLLCETFPPGDRTPTCASIKALRPPFVKPLDARKKLAKEALEKLLADASAPPPSGTPPSGP